MNQKSKISPIANTLLVSGIMLSSLSANAAEDYQHKLLFTPSSSILVAEARGRVMIYDGLEIETVEQAMDEQFNRIENMMFVRTQYPQDDGDYEIEEDGCD